MAKKYVVTMELTLTEFYGYKPKAVKEIIEDQMEDMFPDSFRKIAKVTVNEVVQQKK
jgi:hypothetical protein